jgi:hypothetical protein
VTLPPSAAKTKEETNKPRFRPRTTSKKAKASQDFLPAFVSNDLFGFIFFSLKICASEN